MVFLKPDPGMSFCPQCRGDGLVYCVCDGTEPSCWCSGKGTFVCEACSGTGQMDDAALSQYWKSKHEILDTAQQEDRSIATALQAAISDMVDEDLWPSGTALHEVPARLVDKLKDLQSLQQHLDVCDDAAIRALSYTPVDLRCGCPGQNCANTVYQIVHKEWLAGNHAACLAAAGQQLRRSLTEVAVSKDVLLKPELRTAVWQLVQEYDRQVKEADTSAQPHSGGTK